MSPRPSSSSATARNASAPYRRTAAPPKSTRQQFSACGACRMRRVRCDLKDLNVAAAGPNPTCSNCKERGIKCVDEFADVKAVKLLRRGRRLQQVEAIYGKTSEANGHSNSPCRSSSIPALQPDFFYSNFWRWFCIQRPILDAMEFSSRFMSHYQGDKPLCPEGGIITMLLVIWAFTFGLDERGLRNESDAESSGSSSGQEHGLDGGSPTGGAAFIQRSHERRETTQAMVQQVLELIDVHGLLRRPSLDGIRALLLLLPLMEDVKPLERQAIHDATLLQVQALCTSSPGSSSMHTNTHSFEEATVRARLFWYAFTQEGLVDGIRGNRFVLNTDDYDAFQQSMPSLSYPRDIDGVASSSSPPPVLLTPEAQVFNRLISSSTLPSQLSMACRKIHTVLTGPKAARRAEEHKLIDANGMREIWSDLDRCWHEFNSIRRSAANNEEPTSRIDTEQYACAWQIFIFECHNVIRESLRQYSSLASSPHGGAASSRPSSVSSTSPYLSPQHLQTIATRKCMSLLPKVIRIMKCCIGTPQDSARFGLFSWDSGLVRDGCFFAGYLAASADEDFLDPPHDMQHAQSDESDPSLPRLSTEEGVAICLSALSAMRWSFSRSEERQETIRMVWEDRKVKRHGQSPHYPDISFDATYPHANALSNPHLQSAFQPTNRAMLPATSSSYVDRPMLPALSAFSALRRAESAPSTACTTDGQGSHGWPTYTPPGTANSLTTSAGTALSIRGSPEFPNTLPASYKPTADEYYHTGGDMFTYNVPVASPHTNDLVHSFPPRHSSLDGHGMSHQTHAAQYVSSHFTQPAVASSNDYVASCPQFGDNCNAPYHHH